MWIKKSVSKIGSPHITFFRQSLPISLFVKFHCPLAALIQAAMSKGTFFHEWPLTHYLYFLYMDSKSGGKKKLYYWYQRDTCRPPSPVQHRASLAPSSCILLPNPMLCLEVVLLEYVNFHTWQFHFLLEQWKQSINQSILATMSKSMNHPPHGICIVTCTN